MSFILAVAPMMDCTDRHDRYFLRLLAPNILLYTEMITAQALKYGNQTNLLDFDQSEKYLALQLGGSDPETLAKAAKLGEDWGYNEINLNCGCPSNRVQSGYFGAILMKDLTLVQHCIAEMVESVSIPVTVKCRIGVDDEDSYSFLHTFVEGIAKIGVRTIIIHGRAAWLNGISPKENRHLPPLNYPRVWEIKKAFPGLSIIINGGIKTLEDVKRHEYQVDGVMIGRQAYKNPYFLAELEKNYFNTPLISRELVIEKYISYISEQLKNKVRLSRMTRHLFGLYHGQPKANYWRRFLSENSYKPNADASILYKALEGMQK